MLGPLRYPWVGHLAANQKCPCIVSTAEKITAHYSLTTSFPALRSMGYCITLTLTHCPALGSPQHERVRFADHRGLVTTSDLAMGVLGVLGVLERSRCVNGSTPTRTTVLSTTTDGISAWHEHPASHTPAGMRVTRCSVNAQRLTARVKYPQTLETGHQQCT